MMLKLFALAFRYPFEKLKAFTMLGWNLRPRGSSRKITSLMLSEGLFSQFSIGQKVAWHFQEANSLLSRNGSYGGSNHFNNLEGVFH